MQAEDYLIDSEITESFILAQSAISINENTDEEGKSNRVSIIDKFALDQEGDRAMSEIQKKPKFDELDEQILKTLYTSNDQ